jgi:hypothetical protein
MPSWFAKLLDLLLREKIMALLFFTSYHLLCVDLLY